MKAADPLAVRRLVDKPVRRQRELAPFGARCCRKAELVHKGHPQWVACVCAFLEWCPVHGLFCVGTHD